MRIQRYLSKDRSRLEDFGKYDFQQRYDFNWYFTKNKIGISGNPSTEAEAFMDGILVTEDELIVTNSLKNPTIRRSSEGIFAVIRADNGHTVEVRGLVDLLLHNPLTHMYLSSAGVDNRVDVLTFSSVEPSREIYDKGKILPARANKLALLQEQENEKVIKRIEKLRNKALKKRK